MDEMNSQDSSRCELCGQEELCQDCTPQIAQIPAKKTSLEEGESAVWFVLKESEARKIVAASENGRAHEVVALLKQQLWWPEICAAVRGLRHLKPLGYIELSNPLPFSKF